MTPRQRLFRALLFPALALVVAAGLYAAREPDRVRPAVRADGAEVEKVCGGFRFTEGPVARGDTLWFTEHRESQVWRWTPESGAGLWREDTDGVGGLYFTPSGDMAATASADRSIVIRDMATGKVRRFAKGYMDKEFNGPNDLWVAPDGSMWFTDPDFGRVESDFGGGTVFYVSPEGAAKPVIGDMKKPNGIVGTSDGRTLYVVDNEDERTWAFDILPGGRLENRRLFAETGIDGMTIDERGNVYLTADAVHVFDPGGVPVEIIAVPETPSNCCFGGADGRTLFITARTSVYALRMSVRGM